MMGGLVMLQITLCILLYIDFVPAQQIAYTQEGFITGKEFTTRKGRSIAGFLGIPYARPPVGDLRFKNPEPAEYREKVLEADKDANQCPQLHENGTVVGNEDCLYLNVYTPNLNNGGFLPVMMFIHGGNFVRGNGSSILYGPEYLLDEDVLLVTFNYRLGVLGFLATGDDQASGNFGLKDQVLALKWVQNNIHSFGGLASRITLFGQGAGSASVSLHAGMDTSDGLFHQIICQSGTALAFWVVNRIEDYTQHTLDLGEYLDCPTKDSRSLVKCLREVDISRLIDTNDIFNDTYYLFNTWGPVEEPPAKGAFMTDPMFGRLFDFGLKDYPSIIGHTRDEGLILTAQFYTNSGVYEKLMNNFDAFIRHMVKILFRDNCEFCFDKIKKVYFNNTIPSDKETFTKGMTDFISDSVFLYYTDWLTGKSRTESNVYTHFYSFEYRGTISQTARVTGNDDNLGVMHGDDLIYQFPMKMNNFQQPQLRYSKSDELMIDTMVELWTSFARTGIARSKSLPESFVWPVYDEYRPYLQIGNNRSTSLEVFKPFDGERLTFWHSLMQEHLTRAYLTMYRNK